MSLCNAVTTVNIQWGRLAKVEKKKKLNLYTNKTSQLIKNKTKKTTFSVYICGRKSVFTVQLYFSVATHLQENQHHLEIL